MTTPALHPLPILADDRERAGGVVKRLEAMAELKVSVRRLTVGDYQVGERFIVERKTVGDLLQSLRDRRLGAQLNRLALAPHMALLLIEGSLESLARSGVSLAEIRRIILETTVLHDVKIVWSSGPDDSAAWLAALASIAIDPRRNPHGDFSPGARRGFSHPVQGRKPFAAVSNNAALKQLEHIPGLGSVRAAALLEHFGSVAALKQAHPGQIEAVQGIGPGLARQVLRALGKSITST